MRKQKIKQPFVISLGLAVAICLPALNAQPDGFKIVGPGGGGAMFHPTISPRDASEVLVSCDMTGSYISHDGGHSWRMFNLRGTVRFFAFDPARPGTIYAGAAGLWRSTDDGLSWALLWPAPATVRGVRMNTDHADETILSSEGPAGQMTALAIDPADSRLLAAGVVKEGKAAVSLSTDEGATWRKDYDLPGTARRVWIDPAGRASSKGNRDIYIGGAWGVAIRHKGVWQNRPAPKGVVFTDISAGF